MRLRVTTPDWTRIVIAPNRWSEAEVVAHYFRRLDYRPDPKEVTVERMEGT